MAERPSKKHLSYFVVGLLLRRGAVAARLAHNQEVECAIHSVRNHMAIKVISEGPVKTKEIVCGNCWYKLEYTPEDIREAGGYCMGDYDIDYYIDCPKCKHANRVRKY